MVSRIECHQNAYLLKVDPKLMRNTRNLCLLFALIKQPGGYTDQVKILVGRSGSSVSMSDFGLNVVQINGGDRSTEDGDILIQAKLCRTTARPTSGNGLIDQAELSECTRKQLVIAASALKNTAKMNRPRIDPVVKTQTFRPITRRPSFAVLKPVANQDKVAKSMTNIQKCARTIEIKAQTISTRTRFDALRTPSLPTQRAEESLLPIQVVRTVSMPGTFENMKFRRRRPRWPSLEEYMGLCTSATRKLQNVYSDVSQNGAQPGKRVSSSNSQDDGLVEDKLLDTKQSSLSPRVLPIVIPTHTCNGDSECQCCHSQADNDVTTDQPESVSGSRASSRLSVNSLSGILTASTASKHKLTYVRI
ncbi:hypothetical protein CAPTEDRAFT_224729 [Capitella teleta]|uniref:Uncharacterized protein n=1 Tax=Capitella teleta TaxID=283909 RepID=R7V802_CAPTE|nr:hypothetical protein CAPTEDRAFT_224729 [Capitella teleta]|eukprot:ELU14659.1 hypothetical protein CAPTEDRAFT_224729 [Capitella teleta]